MCPIRKRDGPTDDVESRTLAQRVTGSRVPPFEEFLEANRATVYRFLSVAVGPADADDVFQETFLSALRAYPRLDDGSKLDRWVLTIASRKAIDHHRAQGRRPTPTDEVPERAVADDPSYADDPLWSAVAALPPRQRVAVVHRHVLDRPYDEIATLMGSTPEAARANVHQGTKRLREVMAMELMR
jgi:RNA polymerase sigma factor (sigma-70 family)